MPLTITPLSPRFGAQIEGVDLGVLDDATFDALYAAWLKHHVLVLRNQTISDTQFEAFSARLGTLDPPPNQGAGRKSPPGFPNLYVISNKKDGTGEPIGALGDGEASWHTDMSYLQDPPAASMLISRILPAWGGDTWFCSMPGALASLPPALRARIAQISIKHDGTYDSGGNIRKGMAHNDDPSTSAGALHPAIIAHPESGVQSLYLGRRRNAYVAGLPLAASEALLDELWTYAALPENLYRHQWRVGDVVLWDNRTTMHRRDAFDPTTERTMHRSQIKAKGSLNRAMQAA
jgi:taurine dioxygenase